MTDRDPFEREVLRAGPLTADESAFEPTEGEEGPQVHRFITPFAESRHPDDPDTETAVWYHDKHPHAAVIRAWLDANPRLRESTADHIQSRLADVDWVYSHTFMESVRNEYALPTTQEVIDQRREDYGGGGTSTGECPACGTALDRGESYHDHLVDCPDWGGA